MDDLLFIDKPKKPIIVTAKVGTHPVRRVELWNLPEHCGSERMHFRELYEGAKWLPAICTAVRDTGAGEVYFLELN